MLTKVMVLAAALSLVACVASPEGEEVRLAVAVAPPPDQQADGVRDGDLEAAAHSDEPPNLCELLPSDPEDPCTYLCDPEAFAAFLPPHQCVTFVCKLTNGTTHLAGGCQL